jgi:DNA-binding XRE family transcriptional regulator
MIAVAENGLETDAMWKKIELSAITILRIEDGKVAHVLVIPL